MAKRGADKQITQDNWDEEEESEEAGRFREASKEELQKRQFRRAKRRAGGTDDAPTSAPVFKGFAGFGASAAATTTSVGSLFMTSTASIAPAAKQAFAPAAATVPTSLSTDGSDSPKPLATTVGTSSTAAVAAPAAVAASTCRDPQFSVELQALNEAVVDWISLHVKKNACCILTPVFEDYEKHLENLRVKYPITVGSNANGHHAGAEAATKPLASDAGQATGVTKAPAAVEAGSAAAPKTTAYTFQAAAPSVFAGFGKPTVPAASGTVAAGASSAASTSGPTFSFGNSSTGASSAAPTSGPSGPPTFSFGTSSTGSGQPFPAFGNKITSVTSATGAASSAIDTPEAKKPSSSAGDGSTVSAGGLFKFGNAAVSSTQTPATTSGPLFQFGTKLPTSSGVGVPGSLFQFGTKPLGNSESSLTAADAPKPGTSFLFQNVSAKAGASVGASAEGSGAGGEDAEDNEEYVPPKPEVTNAVAEEGSVYTKRVKLFYKKDEAFVDKGIGNLFIKKVDTKTQLILRADTNLGNILLNIVLKDNMPVVRQGVNNVSLVCIPNPPMDPKLDATKPVALLLRVKTAADADELAAELNKHKKQA